MSTEDNSSDVAVQLAHVARDLLAQNSVQDTLNRITHHACQMVAGCEQAGILLVRPKKRVETAAATADLVRQSVHAQGELGEGPCFDAAWEGRTYRVPDMAAETRWPRYAPQAHQLGVRSMLGFQLFTENGNLGALDLYSTVPNAFGEKAELDGWLFASHAAVALSSAHSDEHLRTAVDTRQEIGEALGILMERFKITSTGAFDLLKKSSQHHNIKLREVANSVATTGELPGA